MGNSASTRHHQDDSVDFGAIAPHGVYTAQQDWNHAIVAQLIADRRLAPFYRPLEDYEDGWDEDRILSARKEFPDQSTNQSREGVATGEFQTPTPPLSRPPSKHAKPSSTKEPNRINEVSVYKNAVECPICFLYYPPNINFSRCCSHPICTECFVQIKRSEPSPTHLVSDPACCPYCVQDNFGVTYSAPSWRAGINSENHPRHLRPEAIHQIQTERPDTSKRKSFSADSPEVVTIDQIRPDWEAKLQAVQAAVQRRANRRIIMRQVGDRLIPVGVTSGRIHPIGQDLGGGIAGLDGSNTPQGDEGARGSRRRRGGGNGSGPAMDLTQFLGMNGQDIEELMVMEAMRQSLAEHEEAQRRAAQARQNNNGNGEIPSNGGENESSTRNTQVSSPPLSFVLPQRHRAPSPRGSGYSTPDAGEGQPRSRTPVPGVGTSASRTSPLAQAANQIALGFALPRQPTPNPADASSSVDPLPETVQILTDSSQQKPAPTPKAPAESQASAGSVSGEVSVPVPDSERHHPPDSVTRHQTENTPEEYGERGDSSVPSIPLGDETSGRELSNHGNGEAITSEREDSSSKTGNAPGPATTQRSIDSATSAVFDVQTPSTYKVLPSTPEDSMATQPLLQRVQVAEPNKGNEEGGRNS